MSLSLEHINTVLGNLEAVLEGRTDVEEYSLGGRSLKKMNIADLLMWQKTYLGYKASAEAAEAVAAGLPNPRRAYVRMGRP